MNLVLPSVAVVLVVEHKRATQVISPHLQEAMELVPVVAKHFSMVVEVLVMDITHHHHHLSVESAAVLKRAVMA